MEELNNETTASAWNRRTVLKGAAAGTALWAAPSVLSLSTASAASAQNCGPANCVTTCVASPDCLCGEKVQGGSDCFTTGFCNSNGQEICQTDADCEAQGFSGYVCINFVPGTCDAGACQGTHTACVDVCANGQARKQTRSGQHRFTAVHR